MIVQGVQETAQSAKSLGRGSYSAVYTVQYKGLKCATKKVLHEQGMGYAICRFQEVCAILGHPYNIYRQPVSMLLTRMMKTNFRVVHLKTFSQTDMIQMSPESLEPIPLTNCEVVTLPSGSQCIKILITLRVEPQDGSPHTESEQNGRESFASEKNSPEKYWKAVYQEVFADEEEEQLMCVRVRACDHVHIVDGIEVFLSEEKVVSLTD